MKKYLFLPEDLEALRKYIETIKEQIRAVNAGVGESTEEGSETWHDNIRHEELMRKFHLLQSNLDKFVDILRNAHPSVPIKTDKIDIGSTVLVRDISTNEEQTLQIGSYINIPEQPGRISYEAPIAQLLMGRKAGHKVSGQIGPKLVEYEILKVN